MNDAAAKQILDKIVGQVFGYQNPFTLEQFQQKFAFDVRLPSQVSDSTDGTQTWAQSVNPTKFITMENARKRSSVDDWIIPKQPLATMEQILAAWQNVNYIATERSLDSTNLAKTDNIYSSENIYHSQDINSSKYVLFSDGIMNNSEYIAASQRSQSSTYCIRLEDSKECSNSFGVSWSGKVANSFFAHDCYNVSDCMFVSHISSKRYCIANMQYTEEEYNHLKPMVLQWILTQ